MMLASNVQLLRRRAAVFAAIPLAAAMLSAGCADDQSTPTAVIGRTDASVTGTKLSTAKTWQTYIGGEARPAPSIPMGDERIISRILDEGTRRNQVMSHLSHLTQNIGPRLTGSTNVHTANEWVASKFREWGLSNVHLDKWGEVPIRFDRGPSTGVVMMASERRGEGEERTVEYRKVRDLAFTTLAWTHGTKGPTRGPVVRMPETEEEFEAVRDKLKGAWVLIKPPPVGGRTGMRQIGSGLGDRVKNRQDWRIEWDGKEPEGTELDLDQRVLLAGPAGFVSCSRDERVWTTSARGWREMTPELVPQDVEVCVSLPDYDFINSRMADGEGVLLEFDLPHTITPGPHAVYNTVADIIGTEKPDEYIIISGHLDSWNGPGSQGCTDNGTGSSVTLETARILMASGAKPKRTIRFILWTGEEQGLLGSRSYVERYADSLGKISAVFVDDGGTNSQGGLSCTDAMVDMLAAATAPVNDRFFDSADGKPLRVNIRPSGERMQQSGGSDHASFVSKGVPGFFWDEIGRAEYGHGWHTQFDKLDLAIPEYLKQASTCSAVTSYNLACAADLLPRWKMEPAPEGGERRRPRRDRDAAAEPAPAPVQN